MSEKLSLDQLEQLLLDREPDEIRAEYEQQLRDNPQAEAMLRHFESLDDHLKILRDNESPPAVPQLPRRRRARWPLMLSPLAAALAVALLLGYLWYGEADLIKMPGTQAPAVIEEDGGTHLPESAPALKEALEVPPAESAAGVEARFDRAELAEEEAETIVSDGRVAEKSREQAKPDRRSRDLAKMKKEQPLDRVAAPETETAAKLAAKPIDANETVERREAAIIQPQAAREGQSQAEPEAKVARKRQQSEDGVSSKEVAAALSQQSDKLEAAAKEERQVAPPREDYVLMDSETDDASGQGDYDASSLGATEEALVVVGTPKQAASRQYLIIERKRLELSRLTGEKRKSRGMARSNDAGVGKDGSGLLELLRGPNTDSQTLAQLTIDQAQLLTQLEVAWLDQSTAPTDLVAGPTVYWPGLSQQMISISQWTRRWQIVALSERHPLRIYPTFWRGADLIVSMTYGDQQAQVRVQFLSGQIRLQEP